MGTFTDQRKQPAPKRPSKRKHPQIWPGLYAIRKCDLDLLSKAVDAAPDRYAFEVLDPAPGQPEDVVSGRCTYHARGANRADVAKHIFKENGIEPLYLKLNQEIGVSKFCGCSSQNASCTDDNDYWP